MERKLHFQNILRLGIANSIFLWNTVSEIFITNFYNTTHEFGAKKSLLTSDMTSTSFIHSLALSPDSNFLVYIEDLTIKIRDIVKQNTTREEQIEIVGNNTYISSIRWIAA